MNFKCENCSKIVSGRDHISCCYRGSRKYQEDLSWLRENGTIFQINCLQDVIFAKAFHIDFRPTIENKNYSSMRS
jgi:hypothetical protein